jgi:hypothetical protein
MSDWGMGATLGTGVFKRVVKETVLKDTHSSLLPGVGWSSGGTHNGRQGRQSDH